MIQKLLVPGCYLVWYTPVDSGSEFRHYDGTLRVYPDEQDENEFNVSGDLYGCGADKPRWPKKKEIPIFPISDYRYYLKVAKLPGSSVSGNEVTLRFELHRYERVPFTESLAGFRWPKEGSFTARMTLSEPEGIQYPVPAGFQQPVILSGEVKKQDGTKVGDLTVGWINEYLRQARIVIHPITFTEDERKKHTKAPLDNGNGENWQSIFEPIRWKIGEPTIGEELKEKSGPSWNAGELQGAISDFSGTSDLDKEWHYHLFCVRKIDGDYYGLMFDETATDSTDLPRQGAAIGAHQASPVSSANLAEDDLVTYFRTGVHEIGHAMGLYHNPSGRRIMIETVQLQNSSAGGGFPSNIQFSFSSDNVKRLRHMPDLWVRPGGTPFGEDDVPYGTTPIVAGDTARITRSDRTADLRLKVSPLLKQTPLGAPVRIDYVLIATADVEVPVDLSLKSRHVRGKVVGPGESVRTFHSILRCADSGKAWRKLTKGESVIESITLLRGREGALFPKPGTYNVTIELSWHRPGFVVRLAETTPVEVGCAANQNLAAAEQLINDRRTLLALAVGGDRFQGSIQPGLDEPTLRPHYLFIQAKNLARCFGERPPKLSEACELLIRHWGENPILSGAEMGTILRLIQRADDKTKRDQNVRELCQRLQAKLKTMESGVDDQVKKLADELAESWGASASEKTRGQGTMLEREVSRDNKT